MTIKEVNQQPSKKLPASFTQQLPSSHLFEFVGLKRGQDYELTVKSLKSALDTRHESQTTMTIKAADID